jgi:hypothetical protein
MHLALHTHPDLHIAALCSAHLTLSRDREVRQVAVLDADEVRLAQGEVEVEFDQAGQRRSGLIGFGDDRARAGQQSGADADQKLDQQCFLVGEVPVDRRCPRGAQSGIRAPPSAVPQPPTGQIGDPTSACCGGWDSRCGPSDDGSGRFG